MRYLQTRKYRQDYNHHLKFQRKQMNKYFFKNGPSTKAKQKKLRNPEHPLYAWDNVSYQAQVSNMRSMMISMESFQIEIDNHSSCCMSNGMHDFVRLLTLTKIKIKGFQGSWAMAHGIDKLIWEIDDQGKIHEFIINKALNVPDAKQRLFYSQH